MEKETIEFFNLANKAECYLHRIKTSDSKSFFKLKEESYTLEYEDLDYTIYDCVFVEDPKLVRHVLNTVDVTGVESNFDFGMKRTEGTRLRYWRDLFRGDIELEPEKHLLYLNFFTLFTGRTGGGVNFERLEDFSYLEGQFLQEKLLAKLITFSQLSVSNINVIDIIRLGDTSRILLEKNNLYLERRINELGGQDHA